MSAEVTPPAPVADLAALDAALASLAAVPAAGHDAPVPSCPGWTVADVVTHVGRVHRWVVAAVDAPPDERVRFPADPGLDGDALAAWSRDGGAELRAALARVAAAPRDVWTFAGPQPVDWWIRRQVHENVIHVWDIEDALGTPTPLPAAVAADTVDEYVDVFLPRFAETALDGATLVLAATDVPARWRFTFAAGTVAVDRGDALDGAPADATVTAPASDLALAIWSRATAPPLAIAGASDLLTRFQAASSI